MQFMSVPCIMTAFIFSFLPNNRKKFPVDIFELNAITKARAWRITFPAVCDGLAGRIGKCVAFAGPTNCGWSAAWEWSVAEWPSLTEPRSRRRRRSAYSPVMCSMGVHHYFFIIFIILTIIALVKLGNNNIEDIISKAIIIIILVEYLLFYIQ
jgi:hypothetical protein